MHKKPFQLVPELSVLPSCPALQSDVAYEYFQDSFALSTTTAYSRGEQVFISYGAQANDSLLQYYGEPAST